MHSSFVVSQMARLFGVPMTLSSPAYLALPSASSMLDLVLSGT